MYKSHLLSVLCVAILLGAVDIMPSGCQAEMTSVDYINELVTIYIHGDMEAGMKRARAIVESGNTEVREVGSSFFSFFELHESIIGHTTGESEITKFVRTDAFIEAMRNDPRLSLLDCLASSLTGISCNGGRVCRKDAEHLLFYVMSYAKDMEETFLMAVLRDLEWILSPPRMPEEFHVLVAYCYSTVGSEGGSKMAQAEAGRVFFEENLFGLSLAQYVKAGIMSPDSGLGCERYLEAGKAASQIGLFGFLPLVLGGYMRCEARGANAVSNRDRAVDLLQAIYDIATHGNEASQKRFVDMIKDEALISDTFLSNVIYALVDKRGADERVIDLIKLCANYRPGALEPILESIHELALEGAQNEE